MYVGTDLVSLGSYYTGGEVEEKDRYANEGIEYDFVSNIRTEQLGFFLLNFNFINNFIYYKIVFAVLWLFKIS